MIHTSPSCNSLMKTGCTYLKGPIFHTVSYTGRPPCLHPPPIDRIHGLQHYRRKCMFTFPARKDSSQPIVIANLLRRERGLTLIMQVPVGRQVPCFRPPTCESSSVGCWWCRLRPAACWVVELHLASRDTISERRFVLAMGRWVCGLRMGCV